MVVGCRRPPEGGSSGGAAATATEEPIPSEQGPVLMCGTPTVTQL